MLTAVVVVVLAVLVGVTAAAFQPGPTVLCIGDSLTYESSAAIEHDLVSKGFVPQVHAVPGSGILDTGVNWLARAKQYVAAENPTTVVVEFIGDYGLFGTQPGIADRTPAFYALWASRAQALEDVLTARGARVYWVVGPPLRNPAEEAGLITLDNIYAHLRAPGSSASPLPLINITKVFGTPSGGYTGSLPGPNGAPVAVRLPDGIHFTPAGIVLFANSIASGISR
jgi:hypothetical protein